MSLSNAFYEYARLSKKNRQRLGYYGVGFDPADATIGIKAPVIIYPDSRTGLDVPGKSGGPELDADNSFSYPGSNNDVAPPMTPDATIPAHTLDTWVASLVDYINVKPEDQGEVSTVTVFVLSRYVDSTTVARLVSGDILFEYWNGLAYVSVTPTFGWEGGAQISFSHTLPSAATGDLRFRTRFVSGNVVEADYEFYVKLEVAGEKRFEVLETVEVSA